MLTGTKNNQPNTNAAIRKLTARIHPGAVVLLHNTSSTNAHIIDELLTRWEQMGYTFASIQRAILIKLIRGVTMNNR